MEVVALDSFARIIQVVFAQMFDADISMASSAIGVSFGATGSGLSMSTISGGSTQRIALFHREFASQGLSYNVSSVSANVVQDFFCVVGIGSYLRDVVVVLLSEGAIGQFAPFQLEDPAEGRCRTFNTPSPMLARCVDLC